MRAHQAVQLIGRRVFLSGAPAVIALAAASPSALLAKRTLSARYRVKVLSLKPPRFSVLADLPIQGSDIEISDSYPAELPQMAAGGWPTLISGITATDATGRQIPLIARKGKGWSLAHPAAGPIRLSYIVSFDLFFKAGWPSPLESAVADEGTVAVCTRPLFLTTAGMNGADVSFDVPRGWQVVAPWLRGPGGRGAYHAAANPDLTDNFLVFSRRPPDIVTASGFRMQISAMGHWRPLRPLVRRALQAIVSREVALMGYAGREAYNVVLVPVQDTGGEAYRQSFVYAFKDPGKENVATWGNTMAHEIFHYWNYARLSGADYASSQWFQEGFTEYVANLTMVKSGLVTPDAFLGKLGDHVANYRRLQTTLENIGTHKGPPLYSAGALVAFSFDVMIRKATGGRHDIGTFFRNLWRYTHAGERKYTWTDIDAALRGAANLDWNNYYLKHIKGSLPLPLDGVFADVGLKLVAGKDGAPKVVRGASAPASSVALWNQLISRS